MSFIALCTSRGINNVGVSQDLVVVLFFVFVCLFFKGSFEFSHLVFSS